MNIMNIGMKLNVISYLKKYITFEEILISVIGAVGYGFGYQIPLALGFPSIVALIICLLVGYFFDAFARRIIDKNPFFNTTATKIKMAICVYLFYLLFWCISYYVLDYDLDYDLIMGIIYVVAIPIIGFVVSLIKFVIKKNRKEKSKTMDKTQKETKKQH